MSDQLMHYKGYTGTIEYGRYEPYSSIFGIDMWYGKVLNVIDAEAAYFTPDKSLLEEYFHTSVDKYLKARAEDLN